MQYSLAAAAPCQGHGVVNTIPPTASSARVVPRSFFINNHRRQVQRIYADTSSSSSMNQSGSAFRELTGDDFWQVLKYEQPSNMLGVVLCYTSKCLPCKECKPIMEEWAKELDDKVRFYQFALTLPNKEVALAMDVRSSPTFLVIGKDGEIVARSKGRAGLEDIRTFIFAHCDT